jgi:amidase
MSAFIQTFDLGANDRTGAPTIAIKDNIDVAGYPTTFASRALADAPPAAQHAQVVQRLLDARWCVTGKTNMHELAFGMTGINDFSGTPRNPQDAARIPGGSSSGSASTSSSPTADAALGTDTGGSIRGPAACCGVIGLKPTFGRVSRQGVAPHATTLDCVGPFARDMATLIAVMTAIDPSFSRHEAQRKVSTVHVGAVIANADEDVTNAVTAAIRRCEFVTRDVRLQFMNDAFSAALSVINAETWQAFGHLVEGGKLHLDIDARLRAAANTSQAELEMAERVRRAFTSEVDRALEAVDMLVLPTMPVLPITLEAARAGASVIGMSSLIRPFNLSGHPALTIPVLVEHSTLKAGLQIVGRRGADEQICAVAAHIESMLAA